ncbi:MAG: hypothetical protein KKD44_26570, partial [Proteobacteria bacterium]|nr:hypothetical protein [Pseudomonadota bacterium]
MGRSVFLDEVEMRRRLLSGEKRGCKLKLKLTVFLLLLASTLALGVKPVAAQEVETGTVHEFTIERNTYVPTKITFNYLYTDNHSIVDMTTLGQS